MKKPIVLAYRSDWTVQDLPIERIDYKPLTHIADSFALAMDGALQFPDSDSSRKLVETAHRNGVKVTLAVGGASSNKELSAMCATEASTKKVVADIVRQIAAIGYDGVDVDWETPENTTDGNRLSRFVVELRKALPRPQLLTMAMPAVNWSGQWFDVPVLQPNLDWIAVMSYDFYGSWSSRAGYHAALFPSKVSPPKADEGELTGSAAIQYWLKKGFPASKILLGIPIYARGFRAKAWGDPIAQPEERAYRKLPNGKNASVIDKDAVVATWTVPTKEANGSLLFAGDNAETARQKGVWAKKTNLAGIFFWELSQDGDGKTAPSLIHSARTGLETGH